ncbi:flagellar basal body-associated FliL family protein [Thauera linaloolentis]|uniref:Flagellar protein FliL n=1 Tax=Thauera linaloolentis (strain DSM 12138 / JCM 21573 / CCUG 41526 / CIP 105981 / IAM 15112 / NBRC 102519 / 47Lol) TaxID=1123367 RepID=N6ZBG4_THAL4|nr:flagellar basal body-associated FliL family protein [Thauera linaloolentis]ENO89539.1 putative flagellar basal body-associated protein FliL [Thauera linaloolentis 47Lol = DSM 12138]MCM8565434.1 flagellar basal body-associated FliL family protein [Thauera linaloolentis]
MAKAPTKPEAGGEAPPKGKSKLLIAIVIVLLVALIAMAGLAVLLLLKNKDKGGEDGAATSAVVTPPAPPPTPVVDLSKPPTFVPLDPFTVNLRRDEGDHYLQTVIVLRVADAKTGDGLKGYMPEIRHRINLLLSSRLPSELFTTEGRELLAASIVDETNAALGFPVQTDARGRTTSTGPIQAVLFNSFIIQ